MTPPPPESLAALWAGLSLCAPTLQSARLEREGVTGVWAQRDVVTGRRRVFSVGYGVGSGMGLEGDAGYANGDGSVVRFMEGVVEVWDAGGLVKAWKVEEAVHGAVYEDEWFGGVSWSPCKRYVVYVADRGMEEGNKEGGCLESWAGSLTSKFDESSRDVFGEAFVGRKCPALFLADVEAGRSVPLSGRDACFGEPTWSPDGKTIAATMRPALFLDVDAEGDSIAVKPHDLGLRYCYNRYSAIVLFNAPASADNISRDAFDKSMRVVSCDEDLDDFCCISPRFSPDGHNLVYISAPRTHDSRTEGRILPHNTTKVLRSVHLSPIARPKPPRTLIPVVYKPTPDEFPGLYLHDLPDWPWLDDNTLAFSSVWGSESRVLSVTLDCDADGAFEPGPLAPAVKDWRAVAHECNISLGGTVYEGDYQMDLSTCNMSLLDQCSGALVVSVSNPTTPSRILMLHYDNADNANDSENADQGALELKAISTPTPRALALRTLARAVHTKDLVVTNPTTVTFADLSTDTAAHEFVPGTDAAHHRFQVTVILPRCPDGGAAAKSALIVYPHGGPHVATLNGYSQGTAALLKMGFAVLYVNYRGSLGLGQMSLESLPGRVGTQEVNEVMQGTVWALQQDEYALDADRVGFLGGSHSGFIGAHTSLYPKLFKRTVLRNPVTNIASMFGSTDIPDWCFCEAGLRQTNRHGIALTPDADQMAEMYARSPVSRVRKIQDKTLRPGPTLLQVGGSDRRVPPGQSVEWKRTLTEAYGSAAVTIRWYPPSGHAIDEVPNGDDAWLHALKFLSEL